MSTASATGPTELVTPTPTAMAGLKVTQGRVLRSEWTKFRSLRSTVWTLLIAVVLMVGLGALISTVTANQFHRFSADEVAKFNPVSTSLDGITFAQMAIGVLAVLMVTGEYGTGMIRSSLMVVPRRLPVLWAKLGVLAGVVLVVSLVSSFASFFLGQALLNSHQLGISLTAPGALRSVIGAALYLTVAGIIGLAIGTLVRSTAAGISTFVGAFFVLPPLAGLLPSSISDHLVQYFPSNAGQTLFGGARDITNPLSPWTGFAVLCGYAVVLVAAAAWRLRDTDA